MLFRLIRSAGILYLLRRLFGGSAGAGSRLPLGRRSRRSRGASPALVVVILVILVLLYLTGNLGNI